MPNHPNIFTEKGWLGSEFKRGWTVITTDSNTFCFRSVGALPHAPLYCKTSKHSNNRFDT